MAYEQKYLKKKEKLKSLIFDYQEKESEVERMKEELLVLRDKTKVLNRKVQNERKRSQGK